MPTATYSLISSNTLSSDAVSVTFSSITGSYRDLVLIASGEIEAGTAPDIYVYLNGDTTGTNYTACFMNADGSNLSSGTNSPTRVGLWQEKSNAIIHFIEYSATNKHKSYLTRINTVQTSWGLNLNINKWANTNAITSIEIAAMSNPADFKAGTSFELYGIAG